MNLELRRASLRFATYLVISLIIVAAYADVSKNWVASGGTSSKLVKTEIPLVIFLLVLLYNAREHWFINVLVSNTFKRRASIATNPITTTLDSRINYWILSGQ